MSSVTFNGSGGVLTQAIVNAGIGSATSVIITGYETIGDFAFNGLTQITSVEISWGIYAIYLGAFYNCSGLTSLTIPDSINTIGESAFQGCVGLTTVTIPQDVTTIGDNAFQNCTGLTSVTIPDYGVITIGRSAFQNCNGLTTLTLGNSVRTIGQSAFQGCSLLTIVTLPISVASILSNAFSNSGLRTVYLSTTTATNLGIAVPATGISFFGATNVTTEATGEVNTPPEKRIISGITTSSGVLEVNIVQRSIPWEAPITNYKYSIDGGLSWNTRSPASIGLPLIISGLTNGETYNVRVIAFNGLDSNPSDAVSVTVQPYYNEERPTLSELKNTNASKSTYMTYRYELQDLFASGLFTIQDLVFIAGFTLAELKKNYPDDQLIKSRTFTISDLIENKLIENGIVYTDIVINTDNVIKYLSTAYSLTPEQIEKKQVIILDKFGATLIPISNTKI